jgi:hypothetical protein
MKENSSRLFLNFIRANQNKTLKDELACAISSFLKAVDASTCRFVDASTCRFVDL